jgi:hypothetical protein
MLKPVFDSEDRFATPVYVLTYWCIWTPGQLAEHTRQTVQNVKPYLSSTVISNFEKLSHSEFVTLCLV